MKIQSFGFLGKMANLVGLELVASSTFGEAWPLQDPVLTPPTFLYSIHLYHLHSSVGM